MSTESSVTAPTSNLESTTAAPLLETDWPMDSTALPSEIVFSVTVPSEPELRMDVPLPTGKIFHLYLKGGAAEKDWDIIASEQYRKYIYPDGQELKINEPVALNVSSSGGHRVVDASGHSHYIPTGWRRLVWKVYEGQPHFVR